MIRCKAIENFTLNEYDKIRNIVRASAQQKYGWIYKDDIFECDEWMANYLSGKNEKAKTVVKIIEYEPEEKGGM